MIACNYTSFTWIKSEHQLKVIPSHTFLYLFVSPVYWVICDESKIACEEPRALTSSHGKTWKLHPNQLLPKYQHHNHNRKWMKFKTRDDSQQWNKWLCNLGKLILPQKRKDSPSNDKRLLEHPDLPNHLWEPKLEMVKQKIYEDMRPAANEILKCQLKGFIIYFFNVEIKKEGTFCHNLARQGKKGVGQYLD